MSNRRARRPREAAATPVMPEPAKGSATIAPGSVKAAMNGSMAATGTLVR